MKNKKKMIFAGIALILLVIVGVVAVNISKKASQREEIARQLELGKKQLTSLEYEEAIATFKNALAIYPKDQELLAGLVEAEEAYANSKVTMLLANISSSEKVESFLVQVSEKEAIIQEAIEELTKNETIKDNPGYTEASDKLDSLVEEIQKEKEDAEGKKEELLEEEKRKQEEAEEEQRKQAEAEEAKRKEEEDWDIREWLIWREGLIGSYPASGNYKDEHTKYFLAYDYETDGFGYIYGFEINGDEWTVFYFRGYDGKSGEFYDAKSSVAPVGTVFHMEITDEIREEYKRYKEAEEIISKKVEEMNNQLVNEGSELMDTYKYTHLYYEEEKDGYYYATVEYWKKYEGFVFFSVKVDSSGNSMEVVNTEYKDVYYGNTPPFDIDQYKRVY